MIRPTKCGVMADTPCPQGWFVCSRNWVGVLGVPARSREPSPPPRRALGTSTEKDVLHCDVWAKTGCLTKAGDCSDTEISPWCLVGHVVPPLSRPQRLVVEVLLLRCLAHDKSSPPSHLPLRKHLPRVPVNVSSTDILQRPSLPGHAAQIKAKYSSPSLSSPCIAHEAVAATQHRARPTISEEIITDLTWCRFNFFELI